MVAERMGNGTRIYAKVVVRDLSRAFVQYEAWEAT